MAKVDLLTGKILLSEPFMQDPHFKRAVVLLCEHKEENGSLGFILNKTLEMKISDLIEDFPKIECQVYYGGPVQTDTLHYIHRKGDLLDDAKEIGPGLYWGGDFEKLKFLIESKLIRNTDIRFYVGYSGWSENQLSEEIDFGSWVVAESDSNFVFNSSPSGLWNKIMYNKGNTYSVISQIPEIVTWN